MIAPRSPVPTAQSVQNSAIPGSVVEHDRHPLDVLADEFTARWRRGEAPSIDEYEQRAPEHRDAIRALFPTIAMIEQLTAREYRGRRTKRKKLSERKTLGDFQIIREIGRGGMGIVYEAIQRSLERRVALKVLAQGISSSSHQLERFRREAESAARLHHTNIVPVYGIGEEDDIHFYAMQYIDGIPLAEAIETVRQSSDKYHKTSVRDSSSNGNSGDGSEDSVASPSALDPDNLDKTVLVDLDGDSNGSLSRELPSNADPAQQGTPHQKRHSNSEISRILSNEKSILDFRRIAALAAQVADALEYAHRHGVLHRDMKPSNLMLDRDGGVWIMDFGLVKVLERDDLTQAGEIVGTLRYMAPEQLEGKADARTDIHGLGLTLFELLTFQPAFDSDQKVTLAARLRDGEIPKPRGLNPAIPADLETIVLKAAARDPSARYLTAAAMAEDLRWFSEDRPILARRITPLERFARWTRRNPALAATTCSSIVLLALVAIVAIIGRSHIESALVESRTSQKRAESNLDSAVDAFDSILDNVTSRGLPRSLAFNIPQADIGLTQTPLSAADALLLDRLLEFYKTFANQNADNQPLRSRVANAYQRAGAILVRLGRLSEAEQDYRTALALLKQVLQSEPHNIQALVDSAEIYNEIGELLLRRGEFRATFDSHLEARAILLEQPESVRRHPLVRYELARATDLFASIDIRSGTNEGPQPPKTADHEKRPPRRKNEPPAGNAYSYVGMREAPPEPPNRRNDNPTAERLRQAQPKPFAIEGSNPVAGLSVVLLEASNEFRSLANEFPDNPDYQFRLAQCLRHRLVHAATSNDAAVARETFQEAVQILDQLASRFPNEPKYRFELADTLTQASRAQSESDATESLERAVVISEELAARFPATSEYQLLLGTALARRAAGQSAGGQTADAEASLLRSIKLLESLAAQFPDQGVIQIPLAKSAQQLGELLRSPTNTQDADSQPRLEKSRDVLRSAINRFEKYLATTTPDSTGPRKGHFNRRVLSGLQASLAETLKQLVHDKW